MPLNLIIASQALHYNNVCPNMHSGECEDYMQNICFFKKFTSDTQIV